MEELFEEGDVRRDVSICTYRFAWKNKQHVKEERGAGSWYPGKWRREWMAPESRNKNMNYGDVNYCVLRYADVVLMAAEAYNEVEKTEQAWMLLNSVRQRAGATSYTSANYDQLMAVRKKHMICLSLLTVMNRDVFARLFIGSVALNYLLKDSVNLTSFAGGCWPML